jgi:hypothetical protein
MLSSIWVHILADIGRNTFRYTPFVVKSALGRVNTAESCGSKYGNVSWRDAPPSMEQLRIEDYLAGSSLAGKTLLHVGVGSSSVAKRFQAECRQIDGLTVMADEITYAQGLGYSNYRVYLLDKFSPEVSTTLPNRYHFIIDNNPSSFAPSRAAFDWMIASYVDFLEPGGMFLTDRVGMHYHENYAFSIGDDDLAAFELALPVRFERPTPSVRALVKLGSETRQ